MFHCFRSLSLKTALGLFLCGLLFTSSFSSTARADLLLYADVNTNLGGNPARQQGTSGTVTNAADRSLNNLFATARSSASFGQLRTYGRFSAQDGGLSGGWAFATAGWRDDFFIDKPGHTGTTGTVEMRFTIDGRLDASRASSLGYTPGVDDNILAAVDYFFTPGVGRERIQMTQGLITSTNAAANAISQNQGTSFLGIEQIYLVPVTFGTTLQGVTLEVRSRANATRTWDLTAIAESDIEHTANWGGFGAVRDANGNILTDYTFSSGSGFNYAVGISAVPEPSSCVLFGACAGLGALQRFRMARRKKQSRLAQ